MTADTVRLLGSDSTVLGEVSSSQIGRAAVALSRGRFPKPKTWVDPNEDAVLAAHIGDHWLLAAADGHLGFDAARAAMQVINDGASQILSDHRDGRPVMTSVIDEAREAVAQALSVVDEERFDSRTALSVVLVRGDEAFAMTCGDSSIFLVRSRRVRAVTSVTTPTRFLGPQTPPPPVVHLRLRAGDGLAVVTDGFTDFLGRGTVPALRREMSGPTPEGAARGLVGAAFAGGAGDNVGVAVLLPQSRAGAETGHGRGSHRRSGQPRGDV